MHRHSWSSSRPVAAVAWAGLVLLLLAVLGPRTLDESSLWIDEVHSLQLSQLPVDRLLDESARDLHPPGYGLALKAWIKAGRWVGRPLGWEPGTAWARGLNLVAWLVLVVAGGWLGRRLLGRGGGLLLVAGVGGSAAAGVVVGDLRSYGFAFVALTLAVLLLAEVERRPGSQAGEDESAHRPPAPREGGGDRGARRPPSSTASPPAHPLGRRAAGFLWAGYSASLALALWSHLLAAVAVAALGLSWLALRLAWPRRAGLGRGLLAHAVPWLLFLPWLVRVPAQVGQLQAAAPAWMTPATVANLLRTFAGWMPLGRVGASSAAGEVVLLALGGAAVAVPTGAFLALRRFHRRGGDHGLSASPSAAAAGAVAALALPTAVGSVVAFWLVARLGLAATFHGPRYPLLVAGVLAAGLVGAAVAAWPRRRGAVLLLVPWLACAALGHLLAFRQAGVPGGLEAFRPQVEALAATISADRPVLHVLPSEMAPFVRDTFAGFDLRPVEELACGAGPAVGERRGDGAGSASSPPAAVLLDVNPWPELGRTRDRVVRRALHAGRLAASVERRERTDAQMTATAWRLRGLDADLARQLCARGFRPLSPAPPDAVAAALPEDQLAGDGWSYLEIDDSLDAARWATREAVRLRFDREVAPGDYTLHLAGIRHPYPTETATLSLEMPGFEIEDPPAPASRHPLVPGPFHLTLAVHLDRPRRPILRLHHPLWSPAEATGSSDTRQLAFLLDGAWLVERTVDERSPESFPDGAPGSAGASTPPA